MSELILYHYTDRRGFEGIQASQIIRQSHSQNGDARHGSGVYLTSKSPESHGQSSVVMNNWGHPRGIARAIAAEGKVQYYIKLFFPPDYPKLRKVGGGRDIWIYHGDINLQTVNYELGQFN